MSKRFKVGDITIKESILIENNVVHSELVKLSVDIFKAYLSLLIRNREIVELNGNYPHLYALNKVRNQTKFPTLDKFMQQFRLKFSFDSDLKDKGIFVADKDGSGIIKVFVPINEVVDGLKEIDSNDSDIEQLKTIYYKIYSNGLLSTILHELQHAYDFWRSKGKVLLNNKTNDSDDSVVSYARLPHEVNARFSQAIQNIIEYTDLNDFVKRFQDNFKWWDIMTPTIKTKLQRRAAKIYHEKEELKNKNKNDQTS